MPSILVAVVLLALGVTAEAQQPKKVYRIGYFSSSDPAADSTRSEAIRLALHERGYIEGQNIATDYRYAEGKRDRLPELAAEQAAARGELGLGLDHTIFLELVVKVRPKWRRDDATLERLGL